MNHFRSIRRELFDIRPGEHLRTWAMFLYLLSVLFAYYVLKPVSRAMFLTRFDVHKLPALYILIAAFGGVFAYLYSKLAAETSLRLAVLMTMAVSIVSLVTMWSLIHVPWMVYVLNIFVSLFSIVLVSQGWLVASNLFDAREAKRTYPLLGMGMVLGAAFGGEFTNRTAHALGTRNLLLASAAMVLLAYAAFRVAISQSRAVSQARAAQKEETDFSFGGMIRDILSTRHLRVIVGIMVAMYLVDTIVEFQFQATAAAVYRGDNLTAFFGKFYGLYLNLIEFVFQLFVTAAIVRRFGVGGTLQIAPACIVLSSVATVATPGLTAAGAVRLTEASTRYTLNRTGMELLYMPLPRELRNRIKAFIDICVDRVSRGLGGALLIVVTSRALHFGVRQIALLVILLCILWMYFSYLARKEYIATIRKRFEARGLDLENARLTVDDPATIRFLETTAQGENPRQAAYAVSLLSQTASYDIRPLLQKLVASPELEVRGQVYEAAARMRDGSLLGQAIGELARRPAALPGSLIPYVLAVTPGRARLAAELLDDGDARVVAGALEALRADRDLGQELITREWLARNAGSEDIQRRTLAAAAIAVRGDQGTEALDRLLEDRDPRVLRAAARAVGELRNRAYVHVLIGLLGNSAVRGEAIAALAAYGPAICGTLSGVLLDESVALRIRRQVPRVLRSIASQRSVDVLLGAMGEQDLSLRAAVLKALNRLRETSPELDFDDAFVMEQILKEARQYFELSAAMEPFREHQGGRLSAADLLARTLEERLRMTLERLFRLLGLRYPPKEIYFAYLAVSRKRHEEATAALEFLDNTLDRGLKRFILPLLDAPENLLEHGRELFGVNVPTAEEAVRELIRSRDPWLVACAMAAAAELRLRSLAPEIAEAARQAAEEVSEVARSAEAALAAV
jgi:AAA family ATP:ADP antiporter